MARIPPLSLFELQERSVGVAAVRAVGRLATWGLVILFALVS